LILNINILESSPCASPFPHLLHKLLRVVSSNTRDFYLFKYSPSVHLLVQVVLSRPIEALTLAVIATIIAPVFFLLFLEVDKLEKAGAPIMLLRFS